MAQKYSNLYQEWCDDLELDWDKLLRIVAHPEDHSDKKTIPLWSFYNYKPNAEQTWAGVRAIGASMESVNALLIDYDDGIVRMCHLPHMFNFQFVAYNTPTATPEKEKLRLVIPLVKPINNKYFKCGPVREYLCSIFKHTDTSTFDYFRRQRMPSKPFNMDYQWYAQEGDKLALDIAQIDGIYVSWQQAQKQRFEEMKNRRVSSVKTSVFTKKIDEIEFDNYFANLQEKYIRELKSLNVLKRGEGIVHSTLRRIIYSMRISGVPEDEVYEFMATNTPHGMTSEIEQLVYGRICE